MDQSSALVDFFDFLFFGTMRQIGRNEATRQVIERMVIGSTPGSSATRGDRIVENLANTLQTPNAVPVS